MQNSISVSMHLKNKLHHQLVNSHCPKKTEIFLKLPIVGTLVLDYVIE